MTEKVLVAMSGGVDSSVAALLLTRSGYDVIGASLNLFGCTSEGKKSCCSVKDRMDARRVCEALGIPFVCLDHREIFKRAVIDRFVAEYLRGLTPSPCILCNMHLKFAALMEEAKSLGASHIATGHYARIVRSPSPLAGEGRGEGGQFHLLRGVDAKKDQSYFLFMLTQKELSRVLFPIGDLTKSEVRRLAKEGSLPTSDKTESQEICFVPDDDHAAFIESAGDIGGPGDFVDADGRMLGRHKGIHNYTIGQRRGLGFGVGSRQYVVEIRPDKNEVVLGPKEALMKKEMTVRDTSWVSGRVEGECEVKIRSTHSPAKALLTGLGSEGAKVVFAEPQGAIAPGQAAVFYRGEELLGGGWIE